jgi:hypothetical protein
VNQGRVFRFLTKPVAAEQILTTLRACVDQYYIGRTQKEQLEGAVKAFEELAVGTLTALARAIDTKSAWTAGHSVRVTHVSLKIASITNGSMALATRQASRAKTSACTPALLPWLILITPPRPIVLPDASYSNPSPPDHSPPFRKAIRSSYC